MKTILDIVTPIKLLAGTHADTATTGQGCAMNVIAYLNGEAQITDKSPCVCVTVRPLLIFANDFLKYDKRQTLVPFMLRAMGSVTYDKAVIVDRLRRVVLLAQKMSVIAAEYAKCADEYAESAAKSADEYAKSAAECVKSADGCAAEFVKYAKYAAEYAYGSAKYAKCAAECAEYAAKSAAEEAVIYAILIEFFDAVLPKATEPSQEIIIRAEKLAELTA